MISFSGRKWRELNKESETAAKLRINLNLPAPLADMLAARGHHDPDAARIFLEPLKQKLSNPLSFDPMRSAAERLIEAIGKNEKIVVFGDFDADGVTATALLTDILGFCGATVRPFIPNRHTEGYGITEAALERCLQKGVPDLLVTVDCGMGSTELLSQLHKRGMALIITDHHTPSGEFPPGSIVVNPHDSSTPPALTHLCGAGIAFQLANALIKLRGSHTAECRRLMSWMGEAGTATVADVVPLVGDNRILVAHGLRILNSRPRAGVRELMARSGISGQDIDSGHLGFVIGPRLNAAGRMDSSLPAFQLLMTGCPDAARLLAVKLERNNSLRKKEEGKLLQDSGEQIETWFKPAEHGAIVAGGQNWHTGVVGLAASRLMEQYQRPAAVISLEKDGSGRGSVRASEAYNAIEALRECGDFLTRMGGHRCAAGFSLKCGTFAEFREAFAQACFSQVQAPSVSPDLLLDGWLAEDFISTDFVESLCMMEPFGEGNSRPCWGFSNVRLLEPVRKVGADEAHLQMKLVTGQGVQFSAIWFRGGQFAEQMTDTEQPLDLAGELGINNFRGEQNLQIIVQDARKSRP